MLKEGNFKRHNILFVSPHADNWGAEQSLVTLIRYLCADGYRIYLVIPRNGKIEEILQKNHIDYMIENFYQWTNVGKGTRLHYGIGKYIYNYIASRKIVQRLKIIGFIPDIVHVNVIGAEIGVHLAHMLGAKLVWHIREFGKQDFNMYFDLGTRLTSKIMKKADIFIAVSKAVMENYYKLIEKEKIICIYNGVEVRPPILHDGHMPEFRLLLIGRLSAEKGQEEAIRALKEIKKQGILNIYLDIYGNGIDENRLLLLVKDLGLQDVVSFKGYQKNIDYSQYDVGLMCSRCEAFGRVTADYMMNSLPVIGARSGGTVELIGEEAGLLYEPENIKDLSRCIMELYYNIDERKYMGIKAHEIALKEFSYEKYCMNVEKIYDLI